MPTDIPTIAPALADQLARARRVTVFTGAGVSAESGIATSMPGSASELL